MNKKISKKRFIAGFTLVEVLVVVVIAVMVTLYAVPAYRRSQERNRFMAASGVLLELGNAAIMLRADYPTLNLPNTEISYNKSSDSCPETPSDSNLILFLQCHNYLGKIPFSGGAYQGYSYIISPYTLTADCGSGCTNLGVACMSGDNLLEKYTCAWVDTAGMLHTK